VYLSIAGGLKITEPAADLAVAAALLSALGDIPLPDDAVVFGEAALSGEIRPVGRTELRLKEAAKLGFGRAFAPAGADGAGVRVTEVTRLADLAAILAPGGRNG
jgi:DNA repair protein RadA/Sms